MKSAISFLLFISFSILYAQEECLCCDEQHRQFDFWVGEWVVKDSAGTILGENTITKLEGGCIISEKWRGAKGSSGRSTNYFDPADSTWNQLWVDNTGYILRLKGRYEENSMRLRSELTKGNRLPWYYNQITWTKNSDGTVTQHWVVLDREGVLRGTLFKGIYSRK